MANLQDIFNLAKADGGKFFVMDESGEPKLVILNIEEYQKLLLGKIQREAEDLEEINQEILRARDELPIITPQITVVPPKPRVDMREEVIDPSFDFEGPKFDIEDL